CSQATCNTEDCPANTYCRLDGEGAGFCSLTQDHYPACDHIQSYGCDGNTPVGCTNGYLTTQGTECPHQCFFDGFYTTYCIASEVQEPKCAGGVKSACLDAQTWVPCYDGLRGEPYNCDCQDLADGSVCVIDQDPALCAAHGGLEVCGADGKVVECVDDWVV